MKILMARLLLAVAIAAGWGSLMEKAASLPGGASQTSASSQSSTQVAAPSMNPSARVQTGQLRSLLQQLFLDITRAQDLLGLLQPNRWTTVTAAERAGLEHRLATLRSQLDGLEKSRYAWLYNLESPDRGKETVDALGSAVQQLLAVEGIASQNRAPSSSSLRKASEEMAAMRIKLQDQLAVMFPGRFAPHALHLATAPAKSPAVAHSAPLVAAPIGATKASGAPMSAAAMSPPSPPAGTKPAGVERLSAAAASAAAPIAAPLDRRQVQDLLSKVYLAIARVNDLVGLLQTDKWTMDDADRALLQEKLTSMDSQMKALELARYKLFYSPEDQALATQTAAKLHSVLTAIRVIATAVGQYDSAADAARLNQPASELTAAEESLDAYSSHLTRKNQQRLAARPAGLPAGATLETEQISTPTPPPPPLRSVVVFTPPMTPAQVKAILYKMYVSEFRIRDLLGQERPEQWKSSQAEQALASQARQNLLNQIAALETWRARLNQEPGNMYYAFQVFRSVDEVFHPLRVFARQAIRYEGLSAGDPYRRRASDLEANLNSLMPYIGAILEHASDQAGMIQTDLDTCQNQLTYAMRATLHSPTPLRNVVPLFEGRRAHARRSSKKEKARSHEVRR